MVIPVPYIDHIAITKPIIKRHHTSVDQGATAAITDFRVDGVGKIDGSRAAGKNFQVAIGCEGIDIIYKEVEFQRVEKVFWVLQFSLPLYELFEPDELLVCIIFFFSTGSISSNTRSQCKMCAHLAGDDADSRRGRPPRL